jgi:hypothetical protein
MMIGNCFFPLGGQYKQKRRRFQALYNFSAKLKIKGKRSKKVMICGQAFVWYNPVLLIFY